MSFKHIFDQEDEPVCLLWLETSGPVAASSHKTGVEHFRHVDEPPAGPLYGQHVFNEMYRDCIRNSCPPGPFLVIRDTMIK